MFNLYLAAVFLAEYVCRRANDGESGRESLPSKLHSKQPRIPRLPRGIFSICRDRTEVTESERSYNSP